MALPEGVAAAMRLLRLAAPDVAAFGAEPKAGGGAARLAELSARSGDRFRDVGARNLCHFARTLALPSTAPRRGGVGGS